MNNLIFFCIGYFISMVVLLSDVITQLTGITQAETIFVGLLGGFVSTVITQATKKWAGADGRYANVISIGISFLIALGGLWLTGELKGQDLAASVAMVYAVGNVIYRQAVAKEPNKPASGAESPVEELVENK